MKKNKTFWRSVQNALHGIGTVLHDEHNFIIQLVVAALVAAACIVLRVSWNEAAVVALCCGVVLAAECFNSAIEYVVDLVSPEYNDLARKAKDAAAGAVLVAAVGAVIVGLIIFLPKLLVLFR